MASDGGQNPLQESPLQESYVQLILYNLAAQAIRTRSAGAHPRPAAGAMTTNTHDLYQRVNCRSPRLLTDTQVDHFKTEGYVILPGFFATAQVEAWHDIFWTHVGAQADDPKTWPDSYVIDGLALDPVPGGLPPLSSNS